MTSDEIKRELCAVLAEVQRDNGKEVQSLVDETVPLTDLPDLDSLSCVDASVRLGDRFGVDIHEIPFRNQKTGKEYSIGEIAVLLEKQQGKWKPAKQQPERDG